MTAGRRAKWILLLILLRFCFSSHGLVSDSDILLEFKSNVFDRLNMLGNWGSPGSDPCDAKGQSNWAGVSCNNISGNGWEVVALELRSFSLASSDVSVLANLGNLYKLDLRDNSFSGYPPDLNKLGGLVFLYLGNNQFEGSLADRFPSNLLELEAQNNFFMGEIGSTNLFQLTLQRLDLHGNNFSGNLPDMSFTGLEAMTYFDVSGNQFEGLLPSSLTRLDFLYCNMSGNRFTGKIQVDPVRGWFPTGVLDLSDNRLTGNLPPGLTYIDLSDNELEGPLPSEFSEDFRLKIQYINFQHNRLTGDVFQLLRTNFSSLVELRLQGNAESRSLGGGGFNISGAVQTIYDCNFSRHWEGSTRCPYCPDRNVPNYEETLPPYAANQTASLPRLRLLDLSNCGLEGSIPSDIFDPKALLSLKILDLSKNNLYGRIPDGLSQLPRLRELRLGDNALLGGVENWRHSTWTELEVLDVSYNCLWLNNSHIMEAMRKFSSLRELQLGWRWVEEDMQLPSFTVPLEPLEVLDARGARVLDLNMQFMSGNPSDLFCNPNVVLLLDILICLLIPICTVRFRK